jgi:hypothetical protein
MFFEIKHVNNGVLLTASYLHIENADHDEFVYQAIEDGEHEAFVEFLRLICDTYGPSDSRYDDKRIYIVLAPGDKHEKWTNEIFSS